MTDEAGGNSRNSAPASSDGVAELPGRREEQSNA